MPEWPDQHLVELGEGVAAVLQGGGEAGVSNAGLVLEGRRALVVDTMMFPEMAQGLVDELAHRGAAAEVVLNTHHHVDHIGGNELFPDARVVAHSRTVDTVHASGHPVAVYDGFMTAFRGRFDELQVVAPEPIPPGLDLPLGAELRSYVPAHTPGDTAVWMAAERVLFTGDLCFFGVTPLALQGLVSTWIDALDDLMALEPRTVVPGHGPVGTVADIRLVRDYLAAVLDHGRAAVASGVSLDDALATFDAGPVGEWIEAERNLVNVERAMQEARGEISRDDVSTIPPSFARLLH
ncbi:MAG: cyclase [Actinomycetota bacterium]|jgi:glyoxylase-like metal-dependent hydrolase (beta-lactamase superfamily II)